METWYLIGGKNLNFNSETLLLSATDTPQLNLQIDTFSGQGIIVEWGDGNVETLASGQNITHIYSSNYTGDVKLYAIGGKIDYKEFRIYDNSSKWSFDIGVLPTSLTFLYLRGNSSTWTGDISILSNSLTYLYLYSNSSTWTGDIASLSNGLTQVYLISDSSTWTGDIASLSNGLTFLYLRGNSSTWTGDISTLSNSLTFLRLYSTSSTWTGDIATLSNSLTFLYLNSNSSTWSGDIATLSNSLTFLRLYSTSSTWSGDIATLSNSLTYLLLLSDSSTWTYSTKIWATLPSTFLLSPATNHLSETDINQLAIDTDNSGLSFSSVKTWDWRGNNAPPTGAGLTAISNLATKNINVLHH